MRKAWFVAMLFLWFLEGSVGEPFCIPTPSRIFPNRVDLRCTCVTELTKQNQKVDVLTLDYDECPDIKVELSWALVEGLLSPRELYVLDATVILKLSSRQPSQSAITRLHFEFCHFENLPRDSFKELILLEELSFFECFIKRIESQAVSNLHKLHTVEIDTSIIEIFQKHSFLNLTSIINFAVLNSNLTEIVAEAILLEMTSHAPNKECHDGMGRSLGFQANNMSSVMSRQLEFAGNITSTDFGSRFIFSKNMIDTIESSAIKSNAFAFLILESNDFQLVQKKAFDMALINIDCDFSAALLVKNTVGHLDSQSLGGIRGLYGHPQRNFIALINNTFDSVAPEGFQTGEHIKVFPSQGNEFLCNCSSFQWISKRKQGATEETLSLNIARSSRCHGSAISLVPFLATCHDGGSTMYPTLPPTTTPRPYRPPMKSSAVGVGTQVWALFLAVISGVLRPARV